MRTVLIAFLFLAGCTPTKEPTPPAEPPPAVQVEQPRKDPEPAPQPPPEVPSQRPVETWADAGKGEAWYVGQAGVSVKSAAIENNHLSLILTIDNLADARRLRYWRWGKLGRHVPVLTDEHGNDYKLNKYWADKSPWLRQAPDLVDPKFRIEDLFIIERPVKQATVLYLRLPAGALGLDGEFRLRIPTKMIR